MRLRKSDTVPGTKVILNRKGEAFFDNAHKPRTKGRIVGICGRSYLGATNWEGHVRVKWNGLKTPERVPVEFLAAA